MGIGGSYNLKKILRKVREWLNQLSPFVALITIRKCINELFTGCDSRLRCVGLIWALCLGLLVVGLDQWLKICLKKQICHEIWDSLMLKSINYDRNNVWKDW